VSKKNQKRRSTRTPMHFRNTLRAWRVLLAFRRHLRVTVIPFPARLASEVERESYAIILGSLSFKHG
jgi:hypothetical protein